MNLVALEVGEGCTATPWAVGHIIHVTEYTQQRLQMRGNVLHDPSGLVPNDAVAVRMAHAYTPTPPLAARLPFSYRWVPGRVRSWLASRMGRQQRGRQHRWAAFPRWPLDLSADVLADLAGDVSPWRDGPTPVVLTHDLDSAEGLANVRQFLTLEERYEARSTNFVVPCSWPLDHAALRDIQQRGHELGIHGYDHSNRTAFATPEERRRRLYAGMTLAAEYGMQGYRAPSLLRTEELLADLGTRYAYDSSIPTSGGLFPTPNNGCASARPFALRGLTEVPLSLPRDGSLLFLGYPPKEIAALWIACAERIADSGGVVVLLTHCEARFSGNPAMLAAYDHFVQHIAQSERFRWATLGDVVDEARTLATIASPR